jgi:hypothetical protein
LEEVHQILMPIRKDGFAGMLVQIFIELHSQVGIVDRVFVENGNYVI